MKTQTENKNIKLCRSEKNRMIGGVCGGLGIFFQVDPTIVRLIFILITIFGGGGILLYLILWLIIPSGSSDSEISKENIGKNVDEIKNKAVSFAQEIKVGSNNINTRQLFGGGVIVLGLMLLLTSFGIVNFTYLMRFLPAIIVIVIGLAILKKRD